MLDVPIQPFTLLYIIAYSVVFPYFFIVVRVPVCTARIYCLKMSSHQMSSNKPRSSKCCHFCFTFDTHNYCPSAKKLVKGMTLVNICSAFTEEELIKIKHRCRYVRKQKVSDTCNKSKDELDLGDDMEAFSGSQADLEGSVENLFSPPPCPNPYVLSLCL